MGISRDSRHKHRITGGRYPIHMKKRKYELGRPPAMTKLGSKKIRPVRCRGGNYKYRAIRLDYGNFSWGTENYSSKTRIMSVEYNASNNELVRTQTLVKNTIVSVDATAFKNWYKKNYGVTIRKLKPEEEETLETESLSEKAIAKLKSRRTKMLPLDPRIAEQFYTGRLLACISSRPGQSGRADGYILEGDELVFYKKKLEKKKR